MDDNVMGQDVSADTQQIRNINDIPTHGGLVTIAFLMGFGVFGGMALGSYVATKAHIKKGNYDKALNGSKNTFMISIGTIITVVIVIVMCVAYIKSQS